MEPTNFTNLFLVVVGAVIVSLCSLIVADLRNRLLVREYRFMVRDSADARRLGEINSAYARRRGEISDAHGTVLSWCVIVIMLTLCTTLLTSSIWPGFILVLFLFFQSYTHAPTRASGCR